MIRALIIGVFCVVSALSMTTTTATTKRPHHSRPTLEPGAHEAFKFVYEPHIHQMVVVTGNECYVFSLSDADRTAVHTDAGIQALELKLLSALSTNAVVTATKEDLNPRAARVCGHHVTTFYKEASP